MTATRVRHVASVNPQCPEWDAIADDAELTFIPLEAVWPRRLDLSRSRPKRDTASGYTRFMNGDVVIPKITPTFEADRSTWVSNVPTHVATGTTELHVVRPGPHVDGRYLDHLFSSAPFLQGGETEMIGVAGQKRVPDSWIRDFPVPIDDVAEQRAIADYLDTETARIHALITKKRRMLDLLEERANAAIMTWVGRSPLGDHNEIAAVPVRRLLTKRERWSHDPGEMITAFRDGEVTSRSARGREGFTNAWTENARVQQVEIRDVVVHGLDGFSGAIGDAQVSGVCSPVYHVCTPIGGDGTFYGRLLRLLALDGYLGNFATSTRERAVDFRNWDLFGRIPIPKVPIEEQQRIGEMIRAIRPLREKINQSEALALEHRQALITAAVTGEFRVPGAAA